MKKLQFIFTILPITLLFACGEEEAKDLAYYEKNIEEAKALSEECQKDWNKRLKALEGLSEAEQMKMANEQMANFTESQQLRDQECQAAVSAYGVFEREEKQKQELAAFKGKLKSFSLEEFLKEEYSGYMTNVEEAVFKEEKKHRLAPLYEKQSSLQTISLQELRKKLSGCYRNASLECALAAHAFETRMQDGVKALRAASSTDEIVKFRSENCVGIAVKPEAEDKCMIHREAVSILANEEKERLIEDEMALKDAYNQCFAKAEEMKNAGTNHIKLAQHWGGLKCSAAQKAAKYRYGRDPKKPI